MSKIINFSKTISPLILSFISIPLTLLVINFSLNIIKYQPKYSFYEFATNGKSPWYTFDKNSIYRFKEDKYYRNYKPISSDTLTLAMVGDSVTWSFGTSDNETYPISFQTIYNHEHPRDTISVYNYGVPGYGIDQEYNLIQNKILKELNPNIIVWNINTNDLRDSNYMCLYQLKNDQWEQIPATHNIGYWYSWFGSNLPQSVTDSNLYNIFWQRLFRFITLTKNESMYTFGCSKSFLRQNSNTSQLIASRLLYLIQTLQTQLKNNHTTLIITLVPYQKYFDSRFSQTQLDPDYFLIKDTLQGININFLDFNDYIFKKFLFDSKLPTVNFSQEYFLDSAHDRNPDNLRHPNQKMYDLMSQSLLEYIDKTQLTL